MGFVLVGFLFFGVFFAFFFLSILSLHFHWKLGNRETWAIWTKKQKYPSFFLPETGTFNRGYNCIGHEEKSVRVKSTSKSFILIISQWSAANKLCKETYGSSLANGLFKALTS